jgi:hypothetical protein
MSTLTLDQLIPKAAVKNVTIIKGRSTRKQRTLKSKPTSYFERSAEVRKSGDMEKALRASAYLLDWSSDFGNAHVEGDVALGISKILDLCAESNKTDREESERRVR